MADPATLGAFLLAEVEALAPFDFVALIPIDHPFHIAEVTRREDGVLEVRVPGRPGSIPELDAAVRKDLATQGFASEEPADSTKPWVNAVESADEAVALVRAVLVEVFAEKPDVTLDIAHGSHRAEHEAREKLERTRGRIEGIVTNVLGRTPEQDGDGDYILPIGEVHVVVAPRVTPAGQVVIRIFAITNVGVVVAPELGLFLARLNFGLMFGRFALDAEHRAIWFDESILGEAFREEELRFAIETVSSTADEWDDRLKQMFGGVTYQEVLAGRSAEAPPPSKPGEGGGLYL
jgi:hypothetical protein